MRTLQGYKAVLFSLACYFQETAAYTSSTRSLSFHTLPTQQLLVGGRCQLPKLLCSVSDTSNNEESSSSKENQPQNDNNPPRPTSSTDKIETFFEKTALSGAEKVKRMSVEERTRRAMVAEAVEDRVSILYDDLEAKLDKMNGVVPENGEEKEELKNIAKQIKVLQAEYSDIVSGEDHLLV